MEPGGTATVTVSSNSENIEGLKDSEEPCWESILDKDSSHPKITVVVSDIDAYIAEVLVTESANVKEITVKVKTSSGTEVRVLLLSI